MNLQLIVVDDWIFKCGYQFALGCGGREGNTKGFFLKTGIECPRTAEVISVKEFFSASISVIKVPPSHSFLLYVPCPGAQCAHEFEPMQSGPRDQARSIPPPTVMKKWRVTNWDVSGGLHSDSMATYIKPPYAFSGNYNS